MNMCVARRCWVMMVLLAWVAVFPVSLFAEIEFAKIAGMASIFRPEKEYLSPIHGFAWWHSPILRNLYQFGSDDDGVVKLTRTLFRLHGADFYPTRRHYIAAHLGPAAIGAIFAVLEPHLWRPELPHDRTLLNQQLREAMARNLQCGDVYCNGLEGLRIFLREQAKAVRAAGGSDKDMPKPGGGQLQKALAELAEVIVDAFAESLPRSPRAMYSPFFLHNILLGFVWARATTKEDFRGYFEQLAGGDYGRFFKQFVNERRLLGPTWSSLQFNGGLINKLRRGSLCPEQTLVFGGYELIVASFYARGEGGGALPPRLEHAVAAYGAFNFPDCVETALRNLINSIAYDPIRSRYDVAFLRLAFPEADPGFFAFYERYQMPGAGGTIQAHNEWADLLSNRQGVIYQRPGGRRTPPQSRYELQATPRESVDTLLKHLLGEESFKAVAARVEHVAPEKVVRLRSDTRDATGVGTISFQLGEDVVQLRFDVGHAEFVSQSAARREVASLCPETDRLCSVAELVSLLRVLERPGEGNAELELNQVLNACLVCRSSSCEGSWPLKRSELGIRSRFIPYAAFATDIQASTGLRSKENSLRQLLQLLLQGQQDEVTRKTCAAIARNLFERNPDLRTPNDYIMAVDLLEHARLGRSVSDERAIIRDILERFLERYKGELPFYYFAGTHLGRSASDSPVMVRYRDDFDASQLTCEKAMGIFRAFYHAADFGKLREFLLSERIGLLPPVLRFIKSHYDECVGQLFHGPSQLLASLALLIRYVPADVAEEIAALILESPLVGVRLNKLQAQHFEPIRGLVHAFNAGLVATPAGSKRETLHRQLEEMLAAAGLLPSEQLIKWVPEHLRWMAEEPQ